MSVTDSDKSVPTPIALARYAAEAPTRAFYTFAGDGQITVREFQQATFRAAYRLPKGLAPKSVVAILAVHDLVLYETLSLGIQTAGLIPFPISPRIPIAAIAHLIRTTEVRTLYISRSTLPNLEQQLISALGDYELALEDMPSVADLYPRLAQVTEDDLPDYPVQPLTLEDTSIVIHSSGSTGLPKPIRHSFFFASNVARSSVYGEIENAVNGPVRMAAGYIPPFHSMGNFMLLLAPIFRRWTVRVFRPSDATPAAVTPTLVMDEMKLANSNMMITPPFLLQIWANVPEAVEFLKTLAVVYYGGGPLPNEVGDALVRAGVRLRTLYGGTEFSACTRVFPKNASAEEWNWVQFVEHATIRWVDEGDGLYELVFLHNDRFALAKENLPDGERGYATNDLFEKHPTKEGLWRVVGRKDDLLVHTNGEKTMPGPMENLVKSHYMLRDALMFGHLRDRTGYLLDPKPEYAIDTNDLNAVAEFRNKVWPYVAQANAIAPTYSQVYKEMLLIASRDKPLEYTVKAVIARRPAMKQYKEEIDKIYDYANAATQDPTVQAPHSWSESDTKAWILAQVKEIVHSSSELRSDGDFFEQGMDSLGATVLRVRLLGALRLTQHPSAILIDEVAVYTHPSVDALASLILGKATEHVTMESLIQKYSSGLEKPLPKVQANGTSASSLKDVVLLTGSTGNLGAEILSKLLLDKSLEKIYVFNRRSSSGSEDRHHRRFNDKGFDASVLQDRRLIYLEGDASAEKLGLDDVNYQALLSNVTVIIHSAWMLDFNITLASFEGHVRGMRNLIQLARDNRHASTLRFVFTSSVGVAQAWSPSNGLYPENELVGPDASRGSGYGEAKYVCEALLLKSGLHATSIRIDQISGSKVNGAWAMSDWVPVLLKTSLKLGKLPDGTGFAHWVPMDIVADAVVDTARLKDNLPLSINVVHPRPIAWTTLITFIRNALVSQGKSELGMVPWSEWLRDLAAQDQSKLDEYPALKLIAFFRAMGNDFARTADGRLQSELAPKLCSSLRNASPVDQKDADLWVEYWVSKGL